MKVSLASLSGAILLSACSGVPDGYATEEQIVEAARACGIHNFKPTRADAAWAAYVPENVPDNAAKEDCIYNDLKAKGLLVTR